MALHMIHASIAIVVPLAVYRSCYSCERLLLAQDAIDIIEIVDVLDSKVTQGLPSRTFHPTAAILRSLYHIAHLQKG